MPDSATIACWKCGGPLDALPLPFGRADECPHCRADVHVCRQCVFYDTSVARSCREPVADDVPDKTRANFCGYFTPNPNAYRPADVAAQDRSRQALDALFGDAAEDSPDDGEEDARARLESLFELPRKKP